MRVRSGFQKKGRRSTAGQVFRLLGKHTRKLLSMNVFTLPAEKLLGRRREHRARAGAYLRTDIHKKALENPYKKKKQRGKALKQVLAQYRLQIAGIALLIISFTWAGILFAKDTFYVERIAVEGTEEIVPEQLQAMVAEHLDARSWLLVKRSHILFLNEDRLSEEIHRHYGLESIRFDTHWPSRSLLVSVKEKHSVLAYSVNEHFFTMDRQGTLTRETTPEEFEEKKDIPVIYDYGRHEKPQIGEQVLSEANIVTILELYGSLQKYPDLGVHSFRLREVAKEAVSIPQNGPVLEKADESEEEIQRQIDDLSQSIARAESIEEKLSEIKSTLDEIEVKKIEEGELDRYLEREKVFEPDSSFSFNELEVYMNRGWSLKLGARILMEPELTDDYLNIFATLKNSVDINGEVKEYIDLRFPERVYYR